MSAGIIGAELVEKLMISQGIILPEPGINVLLDLVVGFFALWIVVRKN